MMLRETGMAMCEPLFVSASIHGSNNQIIEASAISRRSELGGSDFFCDEPGTWEKKNKKDANRSCRK